MPWGEAEFSKDWRNCDSVQKTRRFPHTRRAALGRAEGHFSWKRGRALSAEMRSGGGALGGGFFVIFVESLLFCAVCIFRGFFRAEIENF